MTISNCYIPGTVTCIYHDMNGKWGKKTITNPMHLNAVKRLRNVSVLETDLRDN